MWSALLIYFVFQPRQMTTSSLCLHQTRLSFVESLWPGHGLAKSLAKQWDIKDVAGREKEQQVQDVL